VLRIAQLQPTVVYPLLHFNTPSASPGMRRIIQYILVDGPSYRRYLWDSSGHEAEQRDRLSLLLSVKS
jgi:hypothetical protein